MFASFGFLIWALYVSPSPILPSLPVTVPLFPFVPVWGFVRNLVSLGNAVLLLTRQTSHLTGGSLPVVFQIYLTISTYFFSTHRIQKTNLFCSCCLETQSDG